jgi:hypothetical protein
MTALLTPLPTGQQFCLSAAGIALLELCWCSDRVILAGVDPSLPLDGARRPSLHLEFHHQEVFRVRNLQLTDGCTWDDRP